MSFTLSTLDYLAASPYPDELLFVMRKVEHLNTLNFEGVQERLSVLRSKKSNSCRKLYEYGLDPNRKNLCDAQMRRIHLFNVEIAYLEDLEKRF